MHPVQEATRLDSVARVAALCRRLGASLVLLDSMSAFEWYFCENNEYLKGEDGYHTSPADSGIGLNWRQRRVYAVRTHADAGRIIHELGHLCCDRYGPQRSAEPAWLGWEICAARVTRTWRIWNAQMDGYCLALAAAPRRYREWGSLSAHDKATAISERLAIAEQRGFIDRHGRPRSRLISSSRSR
jgi:hypothetical protein